MYSEKNIGKNIRRLRKAKGMTQGELAKRTGINCESAYITVIAWEKSRWNPTAKKLAELANVLGCSMDELFSD